MSKTPPLISVCVPTYNYGRFLDDCVASVRSQTFRNWELVISDDCSTDDTFEKVRGYLNLDSRIRYARNERRLGMNANIKRAAELGRGEYLKILCADDWLAPTCLESLLALMETNPAVAIATSAEILSNEQGEPLGVQFLFGEPISIVPGEKMLDRMSRGDGFGGHSSFLIRSSAYQQVGGYDDTLLYAADYDLAARLCRIGAYLHVDTPLFYGRMQRQSSSAVNPQKLLDVMDWFEIPKKVFQPRNFGNCEWRRYQRLTGNLTARYLVNILLQELRGHHAYARELRRVLLRQGNFFLGIPLLLFHVPTRIYRRLIANKKTAPFAVEAGQAETT
jgi:glycosyltransferase involved in cell wall biosynthesis